MAAPLRLAVLAACSIGVASGQEARRDAEAARAIQAAPEQETILPDGAGRSETFTYCTACHTTSVIRRSRFTRQQWNGLMDWMAERHGMTRLEGDMRTTIINYLVAHFGPAPAPARGGNPFLSEGNP